MAGYDGLTPYSGPTTQGLRGNVGGENSTWGMVDGKEVPVIGGPGGNYLLSDLLSKYGSMEGVSNAGKLTPGSPEYAKASEMAALGYGETPGADPATTGAFTEGLARFGSRPSNDSFSGKDGLADLAQIGLMAAPVGAGALGLLGGAAGGTEAALGSGISAPSGASALLGTGAPEAGYALGSGITPMGAGAESVGGLGTGIGAGAATSLGLLGGAYPALETGVPGVASSGTGGTTNAAPLGGGITPQATAPVPLGGPAASATPGAGASSATGAAGGASFTDSLISQMKNNALALGLMGVGTAASLQAGKKPIPNEAQIQGLGAEGAAVAKQLIGQYQSGQLQPGQQASLDQLTQNTKNQLRQYFASIGQADSTAAVQAMAQVDQSAAAMKQQMLDTALQQGLSAIGVAQGPLNSIAQYQLGQDQNLRAAFSNFAGGIGNLFGRNAGTSQPAKTASTTPSQVIQSTQNASPEAPIG